MTRYSGEQLREGAVAFFGALGFDRRADGVSPRRLPDWTRPQLPQPMDVMARMPSGVRLAFETDSRRIALDVQTTKMVTPPQAPRPVAFDLVVDGVVASVDVTERGNTILLDRRDPTKFELVRGAAHTVEFKGLAAGIKRCEVWLPQNAFVEIRALALDDGSTLAPVPAPRQKRWTHYGSSISHCMEALQPTGTWPAVASRLAGWHLTSFGFGGQCHLDQFAARTIRDVGADLITIKTGINVINMDSMRERVFMPALHGFLDTIREKQPTTPIVVISPIFCPSAEKRPGPTVPNEQGKFVTLPGHDEIRAGCLSLERVREIIASVVAVRRERGEPLEYVDGLSLFGAADAADLPDDLHPSPAGYARMGERFARHVLAQR